MSDYNFSYTNPLMDKYGKNASPTPKYGLGNTYMYNPNDPMFDRQYQRKNAAGDYRFTKSGYEHYFGKDQALNNMPDSVLMPPDYQGSNRTLYNNGTIFRPKSGGAFNYGNAYGTNGKATPTSTGYPVYLDNVPDNDAYAYGNARNEGNYVSPMGENGIVSNYGFRRTLLDSNKNDRQNSSFIYTPEDTYSRYGNYDPYNDPMVNNYNNYYANQDQIDAEEKQYQNAPTVEQMITANKNTEQALIDKKKQKEAQEAKDKILSDEYLKHRNLYDKFVPLKYANAAGNALAVFSDMMGWTNKPDYGPLDQFDAAYNRNSKAEYMPIGNYQKYKPMDRDYYINMINAQVGAKRRAALDMANGNRAQAAAMLAGIDANGQQSISDLITNADKENLARYDAAKKFNQDTDKTNATNFLDASKTNAAIYSQNLSNVIEAAKLRNTIATAAAANKSANLTNLFNSLSGIGKEFYDRNKANDMTNQDYYLTNFGHSNYKPGYVHKTPEEIAKENNAIEAANKQAQYWKYIAQQKDKTDKQREAEYGTVPNKNGYLQSNMSIVDQNNPYNTTSFVDDDGNEHKYHIERDKNGSEVVVIDD